MKKKFTILFVFIINISFSQDDGHWIRTIDDPFFCNCTRWYVRNSPENNLVNSKSAMWIKDTTYFNIKLKLVVDSLNPSKAKGSPLNFMHTTDSGTVALSSLDSAKKALGVVNINNGTGLNSTGTTNKTFSIDPNYVMTVTRATDSITNINNKVNTKISKSDISLTTTGSTGAATYNSSTGVFNIPNYSVTTPSINYSPSRTLGTSPTAFTPSSTNRYSVNYTVRISCSATIGGASSGKVELQYFNGSTWVTVSEVENSNTVTLAVALQSVTIQTASVSGEFPPNTQLRLLSSSTGSTTITYVRGWEKQY